MHIIELSRIVKKIFKMGRSFFVGINSLLKKKRLFPFHAALLILGALITAGISFAILVGATPLQPNVGITIALMTINLAFVAVFIFLIWKEISRIRLRRKQEKAASRLHVRIATFFAVFAAVPAVMVAIVATITLDIGLDRWFELRTRTIVDHSLSIADAYVLENARNLQGTTLSMAYDLDNQYRLYRLDNNGFLEFMSWQASGRSLAHAALIQEDGSFVMNAKTGASFPMPKPPSESLQAAKKGYPVLIEPGNLNVVGAIIKLRKFDNIYLYTVRLVDPEVIKARQIVRSNVNEYDGMEKNRITSQLAFALPYMSLALIIVLSAIWTGIALADRLVRPIQQLINAAGEVSKGNLEISVPVSPEDADIALLGEAFNAMIVKLQSQRSELLLAKDTIDERRRFSEAVLSGVTAGVIGVDPLGFITIINPSAQATFSLSSKEAIGANISTILPSIGSVFLKGQKSQKSAYCEQITFSHQGQERTFNVQITIERAASSVLKNSYIVTVDDITNLIEAQRSSAWSDVARRIAHEIKNPLTPIQLSAERIRRRYGSMIFENREVFDQCLDTIIRQVEDIGRMVNEFSTFARMPKPEMKILDLRETLEETAFLVSVGYPDISFEKDFDHFPLIAMVDNRLLAQAFVNIIRNAAESIDSSRLKGKGIIRIKSQIIENLISIDIMDNGKGFPQENRQRLLEPYVTTREKGTGLGFAIVRKIIEDHQGKLELHDAPSTSFKSGALVRVILERYEKGEGNKNTL